LHIRSKSHAQHDHAEPGQIAVQAREREITILLKFETELEPHRARLDDLDILGDKRPLLRPNRSRHPDKKEDKDKDAEYWSTHFASHARSKPPCPRAGLTRKRMFPSPESAIEPAAEYTPNATAHKSMAGIRSARRCARASGRRA